MWFFVGVTNHMRDSVRLLCNNNYSTNISTDIQVLVSCTVVRYELQQECRDYVCLLCQENWFEGCCEVKQLGAGVCADRAG